jgi:hypothetical protein
MTVTATYTNLTGGRFLAVRVLNGANSDQTTAATATNVITVATTTFTQAITTTQVESAVYGIADDPNSAAVLTAAANTTLVGAAVANGTDGVAYAAFKATADTVTPGSVTLGLNSDLSNIAVLALAEILPEAKSRTQPIVMSQAVQRASNY